MNVSSERVSISQSDKGKNENTEREDPEEAEETTRQTCNSQVFLPCENVPDQYSKCWGREIAMSLRPSGVLNKAWV